MGWDFALKSGCKYWVRPITGGDWQFAELDDELDKLTVISQHRNEDIAREAARLAHSARLRMDHENICKALAQNS